MTNAPKPIPFRWVVRITMFGAIGSAGFLAILLFAPGDPDERRVYVDRWFLVALPAGLLGMLGVMFGVIFGTNEAFRRYPDVTGRVFRGIFCAAWVVASVMAVRGAVADKPHTIVDTSDVADAPFAVPSSSSSPWPETADLSPLDLLDPADIPFAERTGTASSNVVAVIGNSRGRPWQSVGALAVRSDGRLIATGDSISESRPVDETDPSSVVRLWDADTLRITTELPVDGPGVNNLSFSWDGGTLAVGRRGGVDLWNLTTDPPVWIQTIDAPQVTSSMIVVPEMLREHLLGVCAFAPTADRLAVGWRKNRSSAISYSIVQQWAPRQGRWWGHGSWAVGHDGEDRPPVSALVWSPDSARLAVTAWLSAEGAETTTYLLDLDDESEAERSARLRWTVKAGWVHALWGFPVAFGLWWLIRVAARQPVSSPDLHFPARTMSEVATVQMLSAGLAAVSVLMLLQVDPVERGEYHASVPAALFLSVFALAEAERHGRWTKWLRLVPLVAVILFAGMIAMYFMIAPWDLADPPGSRMILPMPGWLWPTVAGLLAMGGIAVLFGWRCRRLWPRVGGWVAVGLAVALADYALLASDSPPEWVVGVTELPGGPVAFTPDGTRMVVHRTGSIHLRELPLRTDDPSPELNPRDANGKTYGMDEFCLSADGTALVQHDFSWGAFVGPLTGDQPARFPYPAGAKLGLSRARFALAGRTLVTATEGPQYLPEIRVWDWSGPVPRQRLGPTDGFADVLEARISLDGRRLAAWRTKRTPAAITAILTLTDLTATPPSIRVLAEYPWPTFRGVPVQQTDEYFAVAFDRPGARLQAWVGKIVEDQSPWEWDIVGPWRLGPGDPTPCPVIPRDELATVAITFEHSPDGRWVAALEPLEPWAAVPGSVRVVLQEVGRTAGRVLSVIHPPVKRSAQPLRLRFSTDSRLITVYEQTGDKSDSPYTPKVCWDVSVDPPSPVPSPMGSAGPSESSGRQARKCSPDGRLVADWVEPTKYHPDYSRIRITNTTGATVHEVVLPGPCKRFDFTPDGRHLLCENTNGTTSIVRLAAVHSDRVTAARWTAYLTSNPRDAAAYRRRGEALARLGRYAEAKADFARAVELVVAPDPKRTLP